MKPVKLFDDYLEMAAASQNLTREEYTARYLSESKTAKPINEGQFSWMTHDTGEQIGSERENRITVYMFDDEGVSYKESKYDGYGEFGGKDYYELLAQMNGIANPSRQDGIDLAFDEKKVKAGKVLFPALVTNPRFNWKKHDFTQEAEHDPNQSWYVEPEYDDDYDEYDEAYNINKFSPLSYAEKVANKVMTLADAAKEANMPQTQLLKLVKRFDKNFKMTFEAQDHEVAMAQSSLQNICDAALELQEKVGEIERDLPGWIQNHITNAENYITQANDGFHELHESEVNEKMKIIMRNILLKMVPAAFGASSNAKMREEIKDAIATAIEPILVKYDYVVEATNEGYVIAGPFFIKDSMSDEELKAMYDDALDGYANWLKGFEYPKSDYKKAYTEIQKILKKRGVKVD